MPNWVSDSKHHSALAPKSRAKVPLLFRLWPSCSATSSLPHKSFETQKLSKCRHCVTPCPLYKQWQYFLTVQGLAANHGSDICVIPLNLKQFAPSEWDSPHWLKPGGSASAAISRPCEPEFVSAWLSVPGLHTALDIVFHIARSLQYQEWMEGGIPPIVGWEPQHCSQRKHKYTKCNIQCSATTCSIWLDTVDQYVANI